MVLLPPEEFPAGEVTLFNNLHGFGFTVLSAYHKTPTLLPLHLSDYSAAASHGC